MVLTRNRKMVIVKIDAQHIYAYVDETFVIFDRNKLITNADSVGTAWAAGKARKTQKAKDMPIGEFAPGSCYHNMIIAALLKSAEKI